MGRIELNEPCFSRWGSPVQPGWRGGLDFLCWRQVHGQSLGARGGGVPWRA